MTGCLLRLADDRNPGGSLTTACEEHCPNLLGIKGAGWEPGLSGLVSLGGEVERKCHFLLLPNAQNEACDWADGLISDPSNPQNSSFSRLHNTAFSPKPVEISAESLAQAPLLLVAIIIIH
jgi:hypothetical protein